MLVSAAVARFVSATILLFNDVSAACARLISEVRPEEIDCSAASARDTSVSKCVWTVLIIPSITETILGLFWRALSILTNVSKTEGGIPPKISALVESIFALKEASAASARETSDARLLVSVSSAASARDTS